MNGFQTPPDKTSRASSDLAKKFGIKAKAISDEELLDLGLPKASLWEIDKIAEAA